MAKKAKAPVKAVSLEPDFDLMSEFFSGEAPKAEEVSEVSYKSKLTPWDFVSLLTDKKTPWHKLTMGEQKAFNPFIVTKFLSYDNSIVDIVNYLAKYTTSGVQSPEEVYITYYTILPRTRLNIKFIKAQKIEENLIDDSYVDCLKKFYLVPTSDARAYLELLNNKADKLMVKEEKQNLIKKYGLS